MKKLLNSKYRKEMWREASKVVKKLEKTLPITSIYLVGSFTTKKRRPGDVDFIILVKVKDKNKNSNWSTDFVIAPDNKHGSFILKDVEKWMRQKYGRNNFEMLRIK